jgi:hypothetical protein
MRRLLIACFVFVFFVSPAFAQGVFEREVGPLIFPNEVAIGAILEKLRTDEELPGKKKFEVQMFGIPPLETKFHGEIRRLKLREVIDILMEKMGSDAITDHGLLEIYGPGVNPKPNLAPSPRIPITTPPQTPAPPTIRHSYMAALLPDNYSGGPTWLDYRMEEARREQEIVATMNLIDHQRRMAQISNIYVSPYPYSYGGYGSGFVFGMRGCATGPSGRVKFKYVGHPQERVLWEVEFDGAIVGSIDQADSFFNSAYFCVGNHTVKARKRGVGVIERIYSVRIGDLTEITIGDFLFESDK